MESWNSSKNRGNEHLGVNKMGKNIKKSPVHQSNYVNSNSNNQAGSRSQPQPQVYTISKSDFRNFVQQHTGSPARDPLPRPPSNPPRPTSMRLQRIRPPPLTRINGPPSAPVVPFQAPPLPLPHHGLSIPAAQIPYVINVARPPQFGKSSPRTVNPLPGANSGWMNPALSPISAYMQQLQSCINDSGTRPTHDQTHLLPQIPDNVQPQNQLERQLQGQAHAQWPSSGLLPGPSMRPVPSQLPFPSPSVFLDLWTPPPRSPYPLPSPGSQFPSPLSPNFSFAPMSQTGIFSLGLLSPLSPGIALPLSPSGYFPLASPRWGGQ